MAIRIMDSIKTANDTTDFPVSYAKDVWLNKDKTGTTEDYSDLQTMYNNDLLGGGGSAIQVDTMPIASEYPNDIVQYIGKSGTYQNGYFYQSTSDEKNPPTYSWVQKNVQPNVNIVDTAIEIDSTWSSKKINDSLVNITDKLEKKADVSDLANKQDFRIFNSLEEFNEKKGTSLTVVSGIDNMKDIANAMSNGEMLIILTRYTGSEVYFGLTISTGWTKMFTFIKSNELCDVECRTTFPLTLKRVLNSDGVIGDWQVLATMDNITQPIGFKTSLLNQCWGYYTKSGKTISVHMKFVLSSALSDWQIISNTKLPTPSSEITKSANGKTGATNSVYIYNDGAMSQAGGGGMPAGTYEFDFDYTMA